MEKEEELGSYLSAFFRMKVKVDGDIDLNKMSPKDFSVFFHEYIHFIQDFTTSAGCRRIYVYGEFIRQCVKQITAGKPVFDVPIQIPELENNVLPNIDLLDKLEGDSSEMSVVVIKEIDTLVEEVVTKDKQTLSFESVVVTTVGDMPISIGICAIKESMAYLVEKLCTTEHIKSPDFPYNIARLIADFVLGKDSLSDIDLLALCDVSLLTSNPGLSFYRFIKMIKDKVLIVNKPEDIYHYFYNSKSIIYDTGQVVLSIIDYIQSACLALSALKQYYSLERLQDLTDWLDKVFTIGVYFRMERPYFMLEMARGAKDKYNGVLQFFAKEVGSPLMENNQGQMFKLKLPTAEPPTEYLYVLKQVYSLFKKGEKGCMLKEWCKNNPGKPEANADERCSYAPWSRCRDKNLCPYALFWHHRALSDFTPKWT